MSDVTSAFLWLLTLLEQHANEATEQRAAAARAWDGVTVEKADERLRQIEQIQQQVYDQERAWARLQQREREAAAAAEQPPSAAPDAAAE